MSRGRDYLAWIEILEMRIRFKLECHKTDKPPAESAWQLQTALEALDNIKRTYKAKFPWPSQAAGLSRREKWPEGSDLPEHFERLEREYYEHVRNRKK